VLPTVLILNDSNQILRGFRSSFPDVSPTDKESARFVSESDVERMLALLMKSGYSDLGKRSDNADIRS